MNDPQSRFACITRDTERKFSQVPFLLVHLSEDFLKHTNVKFSTFPFARR